MRRWGLATATTLLLTVTACGSADPGGDGTAGGQATQSETPIVPVERSTDLVDPEGSVLGTAWIRDSDSGDLAELEVQISGLTQGFHGMRLYEVGSCDGAGPEAPVTVLPPVLVLENGVGSITTLVGPVRVDELLDEDGVTVVINDAAGDAPGEPAAGDPGTRAACGAFAE